MLMAEVALFGFSPPLPLAPSVLCMGEGLSRSPTRSPTAPPAIPTTLFNPVGNFESSPLL